MTHSYNEHLFHDNNKDNQPGIHIKAYRNIDELKKAKKHYMKQLQISKELSPLCLGACCNNASNDCVCISCRWESCSK